MQWIGKFVGAAIGYAVLGPAGSVLGALLGHQFDAGFSGFSLTSAGRTQRAFFDVTFELMGHVAKLDGRVTEQEIRAARRVMHGMRLSPEHVRAAIARFEAGKAPGYALTQRVGDLARTFGGRRDLARAFMQVQLQAAIGGGELTASKRRLLWDVGGKLGLGHAELAELEAMLRNQDARGVSPSAASLEEAYRELALEPSASDSDVKAAYRRLMNRHHPDKLVSRGLPESMIDVAEQKTHTIRAAYERIKAHRGFK